MSYIRVVPRDLFNEADLLKCLGRLYIELERIGEHFAQLGDTNGAAFDVQQDESSGALEVVNVQLTVFKRRWRLTRPLNSRQPWPLYATDEEDEEVSVFTESGELSPEFIGLIGAA